jgi:hypothetical protein
MIDLVSEGFQTEELAEERVATDDQRRHIAEVDAVVRFDDRQGRTGFVLGSMKTHVSGDSDIRQLSDKVQRHYAQRERFAGHDILLAFMAETMQPHVMDRVKSTCKQLGVRLYARNGSSISRVAL